MTQFFMTMKKMITTTASKTNRTLHVALVDLIVRDANVLHLSNSLFSFVKESMNVSNPVMTRSIASSKRALMKAVNGESF